jgi:hypothetical protein
LLAVALALAGGQPGKAAVRPLTVPTAGREGFVLLSPVETGVRFTNHLSDAAAAENQIRLIGSGVALGDADGDGLCDLFFCRLEGMPALYRNLGEWRFAEATATAGLTNFAAYSTGAAFADVDGDGDLDLLVNGIGWGTRLFFNNGQGRFAERQGSGLLKKFCAASLALADADGDGDLDLYVANYRTTTMRSTGLKILDVGGRQMLRPEDRDGYDLSPDGVIQEHGEPDAFYLNDGRGNFALVPWTNGTFLEPVTAGDGLDAAGAPLAGPHRPLAGEQKDWGLSVLFRDFTGDGAPDLYVCNDFGSPDRIWFNDGQGRFRAAPALAFRCTSTFSMGVDAADVNRDGHEDLFVLDMLSRDPARRLRQRSMFGLPTNDVTRAEDRPQVERNTLFLGRGDGTWAELAQAAGQHASDWSWSAVFLDVDLDGWEDLLVTAGHAFDSQDADTDARLDQLGPAPPGQFGRRLLEYPRLPLPKLVFRNRAGHFEECGVRWGFADIGVSHGLALADLDNDGDLDAVANNLNGPAGLYRNESAAPRVAVRLRGRGANTRGIGARVLVRSGEATLRQEMMAGGRYLSGDDAVRVFAAAPVPPTLRSGTPASGTARLGAETGAVPEAGAPVKGESRGEGAMTNGLTVEILWRNGARSVVSNVPPNSLVEVDEASSVPVTNHSSLLTPHAPRTTPPLFSDASERLNHRHVDPPFEDFERQPLLPRRLSRLGPGVSWADLDGDGREDLLVPAGRGGALGVLRNRDGAAFDTLRVGGALADAPDDQTTALAWGTGPGAVLLAVAQARWESERTNTPAVALFALEGGRMSPRGGIPSWPASVGPMAAADVDGDGDLDLFVGGRAAPARHPEPASSRLYRNDQGQFTLLTEWPVLGVVSGAVFTDLDADGDPDLALACEWGPVRLLQNAKGKFTLWDPLVEGKWAGEQVGKWDTNSPAHFPTGPLSQLTGWWSGVTAGDFDGDGRMDLAAGNLGRNSPYQTHLAGGWRIYHGDFAGQGAVDLIEAHADPSSGRLVPWRELDAVALALPQVRERFPNNERYSRATAAEVLASLPGGARAQELVLRWAESTVLLNRGGHFEIRLLPPEAQWAPAFGLTVADADGDGREDLFLAQNLFSVEDSTSRYDAGRGLWLLGDGRGGFQPMSSADSGVRVYGEQRGAAVCDFDGDGRVDLAVAQNNGPTKLYRNERARAGLRVRLAGPPGNAWGVGAAMRLVTDRVAGPWREVRAGGSYWSQDAATQVLALPEKPENGAGAARLEVRWPGGRTTVSPVPAGAKEITVQADGSIRP